MVSSVFVLQACFLSKLWVKAEQRSANAVCSFCLEPGFQHSWSSSMIRCIHCNLGIPTYPTSLFVKSEFPQAWQKNSSSHLESMSRMDIHWVEVKKNNSVTKTAIGNSKPTPVPWTFFGFMSDMSSHSLGEHHHTLLYLKLSGETPQLQCLREKSSYLFDKTHMKYTWSPLVRENRPWGGSTSCMSSLRHKSQQSWARECSNSTQVLS